MESFTEVSITSTPPPGNATFEKFPIFWCLLIDLPPDNTDCAPNNPLDCIKCRVRSDYFTGESVNDFGSLGHLICAFLWVLSSLLGILGVLGNVLIVLVLKRRSESNHGFDFLLIVLSYFDIMVCVMAILASSGHAFYLGNWTGRGIGLLYMFYLSWILLLFSRSASQFMTVAITIERYLVVTFPIRSVNWFTSFKTKALAGAVLTIAVLFAIPRSTSRYVAVNNHPGVPSFAGLEYILRATRLNKFWYEHLRSVHYQIDFWSPLPLLLFFNFLSYLQVRKLSQNRKKMNMKQKKDIQEVKMFLPVVIVLLLCNSGPISMFIQVHFMKLLYREMFMLTILSICLNSSVNFVIYYCRASSFKKEAQIVLKEYFPYLPMFAKGNGKAGHSETSGFGTNSTNSGSGSTTATGMELNQYTV